MDRPPYAYIRWHLTPAVRRWNKGGCSSGSYKGIDLLRDEIGDDDDTYSDFLFDWIRRNAVNRAAKKGRQTKKMCEFKNVRIPFFDDDNMPIEADTWAKGIRKKFKAETGIKIGKGQGNSLGRANFLIGVE